MSTNFLNPNNPMSQFLGIICLTPVRELCTIEALEVSQ
jgi:hypothetical protein